MSALSGLGHMKTWQKFAIVGGGGAIIVYVYYQHQKSASAAAAATTDTTSTIDPVTGLPYTEDNMVDPATGMTYLSEAQQYGSVSAADSYASSTGYESALTYGSAGVSGDYSTTGFATGYPYSGTTGIETGVSYPDNASWAQAVEAGLTDIGYSSTDVAAAIGRYLARLSLTPDQATIVQAAIAEYGNPPSGSFQIIQASTSTTQTPPPTSPPPPAQTTTVAKPAMPTGVRVTPYTNQIDVGWNKVPGATGYTLHATYQEPASGGSGVYPGTVSGTSGQIKGLASNRTYTIHVAAVNSAGSSPETNGPAVKTK